MDFFHSEVDADDVAQETMVRLWQYCERVHDERNLSGLVVRMAKNVCVSMYRKRKSRNIPAHEQTASPSPHDQLEEAETQQMLAAAIERLTPRERELFELRQIEGLSNEEITQRTGIRNASVRVMVSAARRKVFEELRKRMEE